MLLYTNYDAIKQSYSYEALFRREYRPCPQNEQTVLDFVTKLCISIDIFVLSLIISLYFPQYKSFIQTITILFVVLLYIVSYVSDCVYMLQQHIDFVNSKKEFTIKAWGNPNIEYVCQLVWKHPNRLFDFRTLAVKVGERRIPGVPTDFSDLLRPVPSTTLRNSSDHPYNTRLNAARRGHGQRRM